MPRIKRTWESKKASSLPHGKTTKVDVLITDYLSSDRFRTLTPSTKRQYLSALKGMELLTFPSGGSIYAYNVNRVDYGIVDYVKRVLSHTVRPATISQYFSVMSSVWDLAIRNGKAAINPWQKSRIKLDNIREVTWTKNQIDIAIEKADELGYKLLSLYISLAYATGQRPWSDLRNLKWENLKVDKGDTFMLDFVIQKTRTHILLPLSKEISDKLNSLTRISEYIFVDDNGIRLSASTLTTQFNRVKKEAMLDKALMIRDLRRTSITEMAQSGATVSEIQAMTGWRVTEKMLSRYAVLKLETARNCLEKREAFNAEALSNSREVLPASAS